LRVAAAIGVTGDALERATALVNAGVGHIIDTAHGHTQGVVNTLKEVKINFLILM
jgi:IMP dehydrogenase